MPRIIRLATAASVLFAAAAPAAAPQFDTPAKVAYLVDVNSGAVLYAKNADARMPPASLAKMMTTELAFELIDKGQLPLNKMCTVRPETWQKWHGPAAGSTMFLSPNEQVSVENLLKGIVTLSGNDASVVLAECIAGTEQAFTGQMNALAAKLGVRNSHFGTANGWPDEGVTYVTARDLATIARATIEHHPKLYKEFYGLPSFTWGKTLGSGQDITQANRNPILGHVAGADGLKTGHTEEAGYCLVTSSKRNGMRLISVILNTNSAQARADQSRALLGWGFANFEKVTPLQANTAVGVANVSFGKADTVPVGLATPWTLSVPRGQQVLTSTQLKTSVEAPVAKGTVIGKVVATSNGKPVGEAPLVAQADVERSGILLRTWQHLAKLIGK